MAAESRSKETAPIKQPSGDSANPVHISGKQAGGVSVVNDGKEKRLKKERVVLDFFYPEKKEENFSPQQSDHGEQREVQGDHGHGLVAVFSIIGLHQQVDALNGSPQPEGRRPQYI